MTRPPMLLQAPPLRSYLVGWNDDYGLAIRVETAGTGIRVVAAVPLKPGYDQAALDIMGAWGTFYQMTSTVFGCACCAHIVGE